MLVRTFSWPFWLPFSETSTENARIRGRFALRALKTSMDVAHTCMRHLNHCGVISEGGEWG